MASTSNNEQVFRFMDLPGEIRNQVDEILLCSFPLPDYQDDRDRVKVASEITYLDKSHYFPSILCANRQRIDGK